MQVMFKYYAVLYKGLERTQIVVSAAGPRTTLPWIPRDDCIYGSPKRQIQ